MLAIENIIAPYEFEDRAKLFTESLDILSKRIKFMLIESENKTEVDLRVGGGAFYRLLKVNKPRAVKAFWDSHLAEIESANQVLIASSVFGNKRALVHQLSDQTIDIAGYFGGVLVKNFDTYDFGRDVPDGEYRFFIHKIFRFK